MERGIAGVSRGGTGAPDSCVRISKGSDRLIRIALDHVLSRSNIKIILCFLSFLRKICGLLLYYIEKCPEIVLDLGNDL